MLDRLAKVDDPRVLISSNTVDDAGIYLMDDGSALVLTIDFFTPIVDDPVDYGRISAANALSDVYAMGGRPLAVLNVLCFPEEDLSPDVMLGILRGGQEKVAEAGAVVIGGHTVKDKELKFGCSVVGTIDPGRVVANAGANPGDVLVLTKPIGVGVLTTALKNEKLGAAKLAEITELMAELNRDAAEAMVEAGATAATDVTGFGLAGHAVEMADGSGVTLEIELGCVPLIDGALETLREGFVPGGLATNREYYGRFLSASPDLDSHAVELVYDPQTSGGLLVALPEERVSDFQTAFSAKGHAPAPAVGRVLSRGTHAVCLK